MAGTTTERMHITRIARRAFLQSVATTLPLARAGNGGFIPSVMHTDDVANGQRPGELIVRKSAPQNLEMPFAALASFQTPNEMFYIRNHFDVPQVPLAAWRLKIEGAVERPLTLMYDDLVQLPARRQVALLECAGNGRASLQPRAKGVQWELGAVGNAEWTGVPLGAVLEKAGIRAAAVEIILEGADAGTIAEEPRSPGMIHFARSLPLAKARQPEVLLAYRMNGKELPPAHGFPLRAVVPGWYGMASVKWLTRVIVTARPFQGYFQSLDYTYFEPLHGLPTLVPLTEIAVKAQMARPAPQEVIPVNQPYRIHGAAWSGEAGVAKVQISVDGGKSWSEATLSGETIPFSWRFWEFAWRPAKPGTYTLLARAQDTTGRVQPQKRDPNRRNYMINHLVPVAVNVR